MAVIRLNVQRRSGSPLTTGSWFSDAAKGRGTSAMRAKLQMPVRRDNSPAVLPKSAHRHTYEVKSRVAWLANIEAWSLTMATGVAGRWLIWSST